MLSVFIIKKAACATFSSFSIPFTKSCIKSANARLAKLNKPEFTYVNEDL